MAKDLPYFKFFVSEWNDGDITLEDYRVQGVFINVCAYYWSNECDVTIDKLNKRFKNNFKELDILFAEEIIKKDEAHAVISFLDEQQSEREETSKIRSKGGKASAEARKRKKEQQEANKDLTDVEHVLDSSSTESQLLREEERREEERRKKEKKDESFIMIQSILEEKETLNALLKVLNISKIKVTNYFNEFSIQYLTDKFTPEEYKDKLTHFINYVKKQEKDIQKDNEPERGVNGRYIGQAPTPLN